MFQRPTCYEKHYNFHCLYVLFVSEEDEKISPENVMAGMHEHTEAALQLSKFIADAQELLILIVYIYIYINIIEHTYIDII